MKKHTGIYWYGGMLVCFFLLSGLIFVTHQQKNTVPLSKASLPPIEEAISILSEGHRVDDSPIETTGFVSPNIPTVTWHGWPQSSRSICGSVRAALVNHHILASDLLGRLFSWLQFCRPEIKRVIILSPDHFLRGQAFVSTHIRPYRVSGKLVPSAVSAITQVTTTLSFVEEAPELFTNEHGVGALVPFVARAWPQVSIASFAIRSDLPREDAARFVEVLKTIGDEKTLFVISSDMSHYLSRHQALVNDEQTRQAFRMNNAEFFWRANDDFTDQGKGIWIALQVLGPAIHWNEQGHQISSDYDGSANNTTSYLTGWWRRK